MEDIRMNIINARISERDTLQAIFDKITSTVTEHDDALGEYIEDLQNRIADLDYDIDWMWQEIQGDV